MHARSLRNANISDMDILREYATRWAFLAHPGQIPPDDASWFCYLMRSGRGGGKTRAGAEWVLKRVRQGYKHIALIGQTSADVRDTMVELGPSSIMKIARSDEMPVYLPSKRRLIFPNGATATTFSGDEPDQLRGPAHDTCFVYGSMILSRRGTIPIQEIKQGDFVRTRSGFNRVLSTSDRLAWVGKVTFSNGAELIGTPEHPVLTTEGWIALGNLLKGETVWALIGSKDQTDTSLEKSTGETSTNIGTYGNAQTGQFQKDTTSTIRTGINRTIPSQISNALPQNPIGSITTRSQSGSSSHVSIAGPKLSEFETTHAPPCAKNATPSEQKKNEKPQKSANIVESRSYRGLEIIVVSVVSTWAPVGWKNVYNLSVDKQPEYFVNSILVHNCWIDELAKFQYPEDTWANMEMGLRLGDNPQVFCTTTPRPIPIIRRLIKDPQTIDVRFSTMQNAGNLSKLFLERIQARYAGTRLGRQELEGEVLDDNPNALFQRDVIENLRIHVGAMPPLIRVVVGMDPAVTGNETSDETGIIAGGLAANGHGYILKDASLQASPAEWARAGVRTFHDTMADRIVGEVNNGGDLIEVNIRTVDRNVPFTAVHASRGKAIRAEPVAALYEQGRVHHVGTFPQLEDQMCDWSPGAGKSPDRMDALVWCIWELFGLGVKDERRKVYHIADDYAV